MKDVGCRATRYDRKMTAKQNSLTYWLQHTSDQSARIRAAPAFSLSESESLIATEFMLVLGLIRESSTSPNEFEFVSESARYFTKSIAEHTAEGSAILGGWERALTGADALVARNNGPALARDIEQRRAAWTSPKPLRSTGVAQAVIKARIGWRIGDRFLVRWDGAASSYQLVGGHMRQGDSSIEETMWRELEEELTGFAISRQHDSISLSASARVIQVSQTYGALTEYQMSFYKVTFANSRPALSPLDRWIAREELLAGKTRDNKTINQTGLTRGLTDPNEFLAAIPSSFDRVLRPTKKEMIQRSAAGVLGVVAAAASVAGLIQFVSWVVTGTP